MEIAARDAMFRKLYGLLYLGLAHARLGIAVSHQSLPTWLDDLLDARAAPMAEDVYALLTSGNAEDIADDFFAFAQSEMKRHHVPDYLTVIVHELGLDGGWPRFLWPAWLRAQEVAQGRVKRAEPIGEGDVCRLAALAVGAAELGSLDVAVTVFSTLTYVAELPAKSHSSCINWMATEVLRALLAKRDEGLDVALGMASALRRYCEYAGVPASAELEELISRAEAVSHGREVAVSSGKALEEKWAKTAFEACERAFVRTRTKEEQRVAREKVAQQCPRIPEQAVLAFAAGEAGLGHIELAGHEHIMDCSGPIVAYAKGVEICLAHLWSAIIDSNSLDLDKGEGLWEKVLRVAGDDKNYWGKIKKNGESELKKMKDDPRAGSVSRVLREAFCPDVQPGRGVSRADSARQRKGLKSGLESALMMCNLAEHCEDAYRGLRLVSGDGAAPHGDGGRFGLRADAMLLVSMYRNGYAHSEILVYDPGVVSELRKVRDLAFRMANYLNEALADASTA